MKRHSVTAAIGLVILPLLMSYRTADGAEAGSAPNIVVFLVDDMGVMDTSVPFPDR
jgi:hypothetical protein